MNSVLLDTCILIDYLRNRPKAVAYLESLADVPFLSAMTVAELYAGVREGEERENLEALVQASHIVLVDDEIARKGGLYRRDYHKSHGVGLIDAMIAASADSINADVVTRNLKHFPMTPRVFSPY